MASRTLAKILIEAKMSFSFNHRESLKAYLTHLQKIDIDALSLQCTFCLIWRILAIALFAQNYQARPKQQHFFRRTIRKIDSWKIRQQIERIGTR